MTTTESRANRADHQAYIEAVRVALLLEDIRVGDATFNTGTVRSASMTLLPPDDDFDDPWHHTFVSAERVELRWTEEDGWFLLALHAGAGRRLPTIWRAGFGAVLPANEIRAWLAVLLTMPGVSPSQDDGPYRSHQSDDAAFEASLAFYAI
ncbi:hypothetical protein KGQ19_08535 [Catenulispora sp. NL8]|uniref:DUF317 domain-containing protein n=1 Tax=Catenulispora pinistramenti TaxID=2705254 RepID=A0ABS5KLJ4_9ACTN|nr:hypothetical protein [Catenulispora pinistramenti]MBS2546916.1 hypothetical protein [Catenulispora pinistramenti]